jgi:hypothetical protein
MKAVAIILMVAAASIGACRPPAPAPHPPILEEPRSLCELISFEDATKALGAVPVGQTDTSDHGALNPGCSWMASAETMGVTPRMLVFTVWRKSALTIQGSSMSGKTLYDDEVKDINEEYGASSPLAGVGEQAQIAFGPTDAGLFKGKIVALKGDDVLTMQLTGADRKIFEETARKVAKAM